MLLQVVGYPLSSSLRGGHYRGSGQCQVSFFGGTTIDVVTRRITMTLQATTMPPPTPAKKIIMMKTMTELVLNAAATSVVFYCVL
jgi:hypothetical protein